MNNSFSIHARIRVRLFCRIIIDCDYYPRKLPHKTVVLLNDVPGPAPNTNYHWKLGSAAAGISTPGGSAPLQPIGLILEVDWERSLDARFICYLFLFMIRSRTRRVTVQAWTLADTYSREPLLAAAFKPTHDSSTGCRNYADERHM